MPSYVGVPMLQEADESLEAVRADRERYQAAARGEAGLGSPACIWQSGMLDPPASQGGRIQASRTT